MIEYYHLDHESNNILVVLDHDIFDLFNLDLNNTLQWAVNFPTLLNRLGTFDSIIKNVNWMLAFS